MSINSTVRKAGPFIGTGLVSTFPFSFKVFASTDLRVVSADASGVDTDLVLNSSFTASLNVDQDNNPGGSITLSAPLATGYTLIVTSALPELQGTTLTNLGGFYPTVINDALDRLTIEVQQEQEQLDRSLKFPITDALSATLPSVASRKGLLLGFDPNTGGIVAVAGALSPGAGPIMGNVVGDVTSTGASTFKNINGTQYITPNATDLGTQVNAAIAALGAAGGTIRIGKGAYTFAVQIVADSKVNITIEGDGGLTAGAAGATSITWTGTSTPISAKSSVGFRLRNLQILWSNASFNGTVVDLTGATGDTAAFEIGYCSFYKTGSGVSPAVLISTDKANSGTIHDNAFNNYQVAIRGMSLGSTYSNRINVIGNSFSSSTGTAVTAHIQNPGQSWFVAGNTFEMGAAAGSPKVIDCAAANTGQSVVFAGNWVGDDNIVGAHTFFNGASPMIATGNYLSGNASATCFTLPVSNYLIAHGNNFTTFSVVFNVTAGNARLNVSSSNIFNSAPAVSGTPLLGEVDDSQLKRYGQLQGDSGSLSVPTFSFRTSTSSGFFWNANGRLQYTHAGVAGPMVDNNGWIAGSAGLLRWGNATNPDAGSFDTGVSRGAAGQVNVGNGTAGDASGTINYSAAKLNGVLLNAATAPTIASGFGTSPIIVSNGTAVITIDVGTGGVSSSGVITLPAAAHGWVCAVTNLTAKAANRADNTVQTAFTTTSVSIQNQTTSTGAALAWTAHDLIIIKCSAY